jgi:hypothetical protein
MYSASAFMHRLFRLRRTLVRSATQIIKQYRHCEPLHEQCVQAKVWQSTDRITIIQSAQLLLVRGI